MASGLKIYFSGSIGAGRGDGDLYSRIVGMLRNHGTVITLNGVPHSGTDEGTGTTDKDIHDREVNLLHECDAIVAEVTQPSLGVGYEVGRGVAMGKKILCLYRPQPEKKLSAMIRGAVVDGMFVTKDYKEQELPGIFEEFFSATVGKVRRDSLNWKDYEPM